MSGTSNQAELILKFMFRASHSLSGYEKPHFHYWTLQFAVRGEIRDGMITDMTVLRSKTQALIDPLEGKYLNDNSSLSAEARATPTCETLSAHFVEQLRALIAKDFTLVNPTVRLAWTSIAIHEEDKTEMGAVRREG
jgi:6-pyruvoyl-tetrahydropterin synthase